MIPLVMVKQRRAIVICLRNRDLSAAYLQKVYTGRSGKSLQVNKKIIYPNPF